eukprot:CAMPEP_0174710088 /NCGR_PEP_ID=MMETSP1094-20130205/11824_1 /TAXON_ID=156173 /ORGANISM="Chrysochromulina brevifilum, Strain UTEX LB 985" /LENGTH=168 /DNA_ID=CAMNT_0015908833 /DNA_START=68 /DNA_END=574 /DNA_ORIENTATION=-
MEEEIIELRKNHWQRLFSEAKPPPTAPKDLLSGPYALQPLIQAIRFGDIIELRDVLDSGVKATLADPTGMTPLHIAAQNGNVDAVRLLLHSGADPKAACAINGQNRLTAKDWAAHKMTLISEEHHAPLQAVVELLAAFEGAKGNAIERARLLGDDVEFLGLVDEEDEI